ncbi:MAG: hypothetical protein NT085_00740 [candidate division SR1 bacterium]|nr:hypothetical protein [candidate division SR1 bacterium]
MSIKKIFNILHSPIERHKEKANPSEGFHDVELMPTTLDTGTSTTTSRGKKFKFSKADRGTTIKIVGLICIIGFFFILPTYAQSAAEDVTLKNTKEFLQTLLALCSRGWIILSILAGKLMTNDFVYGAFIHMDIYLWKIRNIMKNFANFALAGLVLVSIIKGLVGKEALDVKKVITNTLVAGILIQASRFLMGAVIDISTIATAGIGAFPMSFLSNNATLKTNIDNSLINIKKNRGIMDLNYQGTGFENMFKTIPETSPLLSPTLENILPNQSSVSGPFIYLGMAVFGFQNYLTLGDTSKEVVPLTLAFALRLFFLLLFTVGLLLMLIANIMRVGLLRIFIIGSPFLILIKVFNKKMGEGSGGLAKIFSTTNLISAVFKPVIFVAGMSLMLIVIVSIQTSITGSGATRENNLNGVSLTKSGADTSVLDVAGITSMSVSQKDILGADVIGTNAKGEVQNFFSNLIMMLLCLFLMRQFIKLSLTLGGGTIGETMEKLIKTAEDAAKTMPVFPGGIGYTGAKSLMTKNKAKVYGGFGVNAGGEFGKYNAKTGGFKTNQEAIDNYIGTNFFGEQESWGDDDYIGLEKLATTNDKGASFFAESNKLAKERSGGVSLNDARRSKALAYVLKSRTPDGFTQLDMAGTTPTEDEWKVYFKETGNIRAFYNAMNGSTSTKKKTLPTNYAELAAMTFYPSTQK